MYLSQHENPVVREILMVYFLSQHRFVEANAIHEDIREMTKVSVNAVPACPCCDIRIPLGWHCLCVLIENHFIM